VPLEVHAMVGSQ